MYQYSKSSKLKLLQAQQGLQLIAFELIQIMDVTIIETSRTVRRQTELVEAGKSRTMQSKHLIKPYSYAMDIAPYPIDWEDVRAFYFMAGAVKTIADKAKIKIRWGGDWNGGNDFKGNSWDDLAHFELL